MALLPLLFLYHAEKAKDQGQDRGLCVFEMTFEFWKNQVIAQSLLLMLLSWHTARRGTEWDSRSEFSRVSDLRTVSAYLGTSRWQGWVRGGYRAFELYFHRVDFTVFKSSDL